MVVGTPGLGTIITNNTAGAGFDIIAGVGPSMKTYVPATASWIGVPNTTATPLFNKKGYFLLVRGDRTVTAFNAPATTTTLRSTGRLFVPGSNPPQSTTVPAGQFESVGNPYASAIDFLNITRPAAPAIDSTFYVWDPLLPGSYNLGGFQTISSVNGYRPNPGGTVNYSSATPYTRIQSGQAFLVHSTSGGGTVSFTESAKVSGSAMVYRPQAYPGRQFLRSALYTSTGAIADGNILAFADHFDNDYETNDAVKFMNSGENFGIESNHKTLSIEARQLPRRADTIQYYISNLRTQSYQFRFGPEAMPAGFTASLEDRYLRTFTPVSLTDSTLVTFAISSDPASASPVRFRLIITGPQNPQGGLPQPATANSENSQTSSSEIMSIQISPNPVVDDLLRIQLLNPATGVYQLQLLNNTGQVVHMQTVTVNSKRQSLKVNAAKFASGFYQLKLTSASGQVFIVPVIIN